MIALSWSGGKDSARALEQLRRDGTPPAFLLTTVDEATRCVTHHGVPNALLRAQATAARLPLVEIPIPVDASDATYAARMSESFSRPPLADVAEVAFGDLFLEDLRSFREARLADAGLAARFPIWGRDTTALAHEITTGPYEAVVVSVDRAALGAEWLGRRYDAAFLADLPAGVDQCGEHGEFHTFVTNCPSFAGEVPVVITGRSVNRGFPTLQLEPSGSNPGVSPVDEPRSRLR
jgi:uncharacterized protein (TIGR00290 family)